MSKTILRKQATIITTQNGKRRLASPIPNTSPQAYTAYDNVTLISVDHLRVEGPREITPSLVPSMRVEQVDIDSVFARQLLDEWLRQPDIASKLAEHTHEVTEEDGRVSLTKTQHHPTARCPVHSVAMIRRRRFDNNTPFYGCGTYHETGCACCLSPDGETWSGLPAEAAE